MPDNQTALKDLGYLQWLADAGHKQVTAMPGGRWAAVLPLMFTHAIVTGAMHDTQGYDDRWCYQSLVSASAALQDWIAAGFVGEPAGWHRHPISGRRRNENGEEHQQW